jgi:hypothetical protein
MLLKEKKSYSSAIRFIKYLSVVKGSLPKEIFNDIPLSQLTPYEIDFIQEQRSSISGKPVTAFLGEAVVEGQT